MLQFLGFWHPENSFPACPLDFPSKLKSCELTVAKYRLTVPLVFLCCFHSFQISPSLLLFFTPPVLQETLAAKWSHQSKLSSALDRSRIGTTANLYFSDSKPFCSFCIAFFHSAMPEAGGSYQFELSQELLSKELKSQEVPKKSRYNIFLSPAFDQSPCQMF